eukprot:1441774-Rhodomonas_salina.2
MTKHALRERARKDLLEGGDDEDRVLVALKEAHLLRVKVLQERVPLPLPEVLRTVRRVSVVASVGGRGGGRGRGREGAREGERGGEGEERGRERGRGRREREREREG